MVKVNGKTVASVKIDEFIGGLNETDASCNVRG